MAETHGIIWYMGQLAVLAYAICNCKTVMWINKCSRIRRHNDNFLSFLAACFGCNYKITEQHSVEKKDFMTCRPYHLDSSQEITNDMALLLHLLSDSCPYLLPYFIIFTYDEWKDKLHHVSREKVFVANETCNQNKLKSPKKNKSPTSPQSDGSKKSIKFFIASSDSGDESKSLLSEDNIPSTSKTMPKKSFRRVSSFNHGSDTTRTYFQVPSMTKYHSVAVPHGLSMQQVAESNKVFVGGCVRPAPSTLKKESAKSFLSKNKNVNNNQRFETIPSERDLLLP